MIIPAGAAEERFGPPSGSGGNVATMLIATRPGAARQVAAEAPWGLTPQGQGQGEGVPPPDPRTLVPDLPEVLARIILRCLRKDPDARYQSTREIVAEVRAATASREAPAA